MITYINHKTKVLAGFVGYDSTQKAVIASFRGTVSTSITDWIQNLGYTKTNPWSQYPDAGVHHGFHGAWEDLKSDVMNAIDAIRSTHSTTKVQLTGHSLGAAIAINAAMDMKLNYGLDTSYVDFGRPRAGDKGFAQALASEGITGFRVTHHHDIVPHAPPEAMGFYHSPTEVYYAGSDPSTYTVCDGSGEDSKCSNSCSPLSCTSVSDHLEYLGFTMGGNNCASSASAVVV
jgi:predicted lipase